MERSVLVSMFVEQADADRAGEDVSEVFSCASWNKLGGGADMIISRMIQGCIGAFLVWQTTY